MKRIFILAVLLAAALSAFGQYTVNFEGTGETKAAYASGNVTLSGISWNMTEALIGMETADWKNGLRSARMRGYGTTAITMLANKTTGLGTLSFYYRRYGTDPQVDWRAEYSTDNGGNWIQIGSAFTAPATDVVQQFSQALNISGNVRIRIKRATETGSTNSRLNIDDISLTDYAGLGLPVVSTVVAASITTNSAVSGGNVTSDGGATVTTRGVCWNTSSSPTISNFHTSDGIGTGSFVSNLSSLATETLYYYRAYATNAQGTAYGEEYSFSTSGNSPPAVPTAISATNVGINSFTANWNAAAGATSYRLDVSTNSGFTGMLANYNNVTVNSTSQSVSGLTANTPYFYRIRAYNSNGTSANSNTISLSTLANDPFSGYYNPVVGLSGTALKTGLHNLIDNNTYSSYDGSKLEMFQVLDNVGGVVRCVYTGQDFTISTSYDGSSNPNCEHTYAQSWFSSSESSIKKADVHHLFVSNSSVNSSRGNLPFDVVANVGTTYPSYNGYVSKRGTNSSGQTVFEPADQHKGNLARALLYFNVRYDQTLSQGGVDMLETLLTWHNSDPADAAELARNTAAYAHQNNRNPFVDHPEYVSSIWGGTTANTIVQFNPASALVNEADGSVTLSVEIINPSATTATTAQIALTSGSASDVNNYSTQSISFPAGSSTNRTVTVYITNDSLLEGTELLVFSLINVSGGNSATIGNYGSFNLEIEDNDIPTPVATAATNLGFTEFTANWNAVDGISAYEFDLSTSSSFSSFVGVYENYLVSATNLVISGLSEGSTYYYRVKAIYNDSPGAYSNPIIAITNSIIYLETPVATAATAVSHEGFTARWNPVTGADSYLLDVYSGTAALTTDLLISEYVEGSSNNKYIEIFNGTGSTKDLSGYKLKLYSNGATTATNTQTLSGVLPNNACLVFQNSGATLILPEGVAATNSTVTNFNGNDAIALVNSSTGSDVFVDIFGSIGSSTSWISGSISATDRTLRRKNTVLSGLTSNPPSSFPTLGTEWDAYPTDTVSGIGTHDIGASSPVAGYEALPVSTNLARVSGLSPETAYSYKVRATNTGDTSEPSNLILVNTTYVVDGTGANTAIAGAATSVIIPALAGYTNNNVTINPITTSSDDYSVTVSPISYGIRYSISTTNNSALNGSYVLNHNGLGFVPNSVVYNYNAVTYIATGFVSSSTQTSVTISGLSRSSRSTLTIDVTQLQSLATPEVSISRSAENIILQWNAIPNATSYQIYVSNSPYGEFTYLNSTTNLTYFDSLAPRRFYRIKAIN